METKLKLTYYAQQDIPFLSPLFADATSMRLYLPGMWRTFNSTQLEHLLQDWHDAQSNFVYVIRLQQDSREDEVLGLLNFDSVDWIQKNAELGIILLPSARGRGFARKAVKMALEQAFLQMNLHRIFVRIIASNEASLQLFQQLGFKEEGMMREQVYRDGHYEHMYFLGLLRSEYEELTAENRDGRPRTEYGVRIKDKK